jgi:hypothetical protein
VRKKKSENRGNSWRVRRKVSIKETERVRRKVSSGKKVRESKKETVGDLEGK